MPFAHTEIKNDIDKPPNIIDNNKIKLKKGRLPGPVDMYEIITETKIKITETIILHIRLFACC